MSPIRKRTGGPNLDLIIGHDYYVWKTSHFVNYCACLTSVVPVSVKLTEKFQQEASSWMQSPPISPSLRLTCNGGVRI